MPTVLRLPRLSFYIFALYIGACLMCPGFAFAQTLLTPEEDRDRTYGKFVALSDDYAVVGENYGDVHVFRREGEAWVEDTKLLTDNNQDPRNEALAISGNYIVAGNHFFRLENGTWTWDGMVERRTNSSNTGAFGRSVDIHGERAIIADYWDDDAGDNAGAVYIFSRENGAWEEEAKFFEPEPEANGTFGIQVALHEDVAIIGANKAAYIYRRVNEEWTLEASLPVNLQATGGFSTRGAVDIHGDYAAVGAPFASTEDQTPRVTSGAVFMFRYTGTTWVDESKLYASVPSTNDFGVKLDLHEDLLAVGTFRNAPTERGEAYIFQRQDTSWNEIALLSVVAPTSDSTNFGRDVALSSSSILVGSEGRIFNKAGDAYLFPLSPTGFMAAMPLTPNANSEGVYLTPVLSWSAVDGAASYDIQVATDMTFSDVFFEQSAILGTSYRIPELAMGTSYYWRARANAIIEQSAWSLPVSFTTATSGPVYIEGARYEGRWASQFSPYVVQGDIEVAAGTTLQLEQGIELQFEADRKLEINGTLLATGTEGSPIRFTSIDDMKEPGAWGGIHVLLLDPTAGKALPISNTEGTPISNASSTTAQPMGEEELQPVLQTALDSRVVINYALIEYATTGIVAESDSVYILNSRIENNLEHGVVWNGRRRSASGIMEGNHIENNGGYGVYVYAFCSFASGFANPHIESNHFESNQAGGIYLLADGGRPSTWRRTTHRAITSPTLKNNRIVRNGGAAIEAFAKGAFTRGIPFDHNSLGIAQPLIEGNVLQDNEGEIIAINGTGTSERGFRLSFADLVVDRSTIYSSSPEVFAASDTASVTVSNSIIWSPGGAGYTLEDAGSLTATYSILPFEVPEEGTGNLINADPLFASPSLGDFTLQPDSPAIDAGDPESRKDADSTRADMGAFFFYQNRFPIVSAMLDSLVLVQGGSPFSQDLLPLFIDPDGSSLTYSATTADSSVVSVSVTSNLLTITPKRPGTTSITVFAMDEHGATVSLSTSVTVTANQAPIVVTEASNIELIAGDASFETSISSFFSDPEDDELSYSASVADTTIAHAAIADTQLVVTPLSVGETTVFVTASDSLGAATLSFTVSIPTGVNLSDDALLPTAYSLQQNFPNPFQGTTRIKYDVPEPTFITIRVYDLLGKEVRTLVHGNHSPGRYEVDWKAAGFSSGMYLYRIQAEGYSDVRTMLLIR